MTFDPASYVFTQPSAPTAIRASTVLPARRENVELRTSDGHRLVGELAVPESGEIKATLITLHPLPTHGGFMDSHVYRKASYRLPALAGIAVLRFNTRGTSSPRGTSGGAFEEGIGERLDVEAAVQFAVDRGLPNRWLVGWSFGTELALMYGATEPVASEIEGAVLLSPPLHRATDVHLKEWAQAGKPLKVLVPEHDDYLQPAAAAARFAARTAGAGDRGRRRQAPVGGGEVRRTCAQRDRGRGHPRQRRGCRNRAAAGMGRAGRHGARLSRRRNYATQRKPHETGQPHRGSTVRLSFFGAKTESAAVLAGDEDFLDQQHDRRRRGDGDQGAEHAEQAAAGDDRDDGDGPRHRHGLLHDPR